LDLIEPAEAVAIVGELDWRLSGECGGDYFCCCWGWGGTADEQYESDVAVGIDTGDIFVMLDGDVVWQIVFLEPLLEFLLADDEG
jgi:hypothetical protein